METRGNKRPHVERGRRCSNLLTPYAFIGFLLLSRINDAIHKRYFKDGAKILLFGGIIVRVFRTFIVGGLKYLVLVLKRDKIDTLLLRRRP